MWRWSRKDMRASNTRPLLATTYRIRLDGTHTYWASARIASRAPATCGREAPIELRYHPPATHRERDNTMPSSQYLATSGHFIHPRHYGSAKKRAPRHKPGHSWPLHPPSQHTPPWIPRRGVRWTPAWPCERREATRRAIPVSPSPRSSCFSAFFVLLRVLRASLWLTRLLLRGPSFPSVSLRFPPFPSC